MARPFIRTVFYEKLLNSLTMRREFIKLEAEKLEITPLWSIPDLKST